MDRGPTSSPSGTRTDGRRPRRRRSASGSNSMSSAVPGLERERRSAPPTRAMTGDGPAGGGGKPRVIGIDVARGLAIIGMVSTHVFGALDDNDEPTLAHVLAGGRSAT